MSGSLFVSLFSCLIWLISDVRINWQNDADGGCLLLSENWVSSLITAEKDKDCNFTNRMLRQFNINTVPQPDINMLFMSLLIALFHYGYSFF